MEIKQAVILAGGFGTRMREESEFRPKPMVEIGGKPILEHIIYNFCSQGFSKVLVLLGYKGVVIRDHFLKFREHTLPIKINLQTGQSTLIGEPTFPECELTLIDTGLNSLTGERLLRALPYLDDKFCLTYGDGIADMDLEKLVIHHQKSGKLATVSVTSNTSKFGVVEREEIDGSVRSFSEKPQGHDLINMGYFIFEKKSLLHLESDTMLETEFMQKLISINELSSYKHEGFFAALDTPRDLESIKGKYEDGLLPWMI